MRVGTGLVRGLSIESQIWRGASVKKLVISILDDDELVREGTLDLVKSMGFIR
jgi:hypothetical protein